jgi:lipopolysaccharide export system ATP-binding protein
VAGERRPGFVARLDGVAIAMLLQTDGLVKAYNGRRVVDDVGFLVDDGEIVGLLGANGAGKTTSFRITVGMITPDAGRVQFLGRDVHDLPMYQRARLGMGYLSQEPSIFQRLTVEQNLLAILETRSMSRAERRQRLEELLEQFHLRVVRKSQAKLISGGERRKLEIARALISNPRLILLDEPFSGVDPKAVEDLRDEIFRLRDQGIAVLLTDHNVHETLKVTDRSYVMHQGHVICDGPPHEIINNPRVRETYLGNTFRGDEFLPPHAARPEVRRTVSSEPAA